MRRKKEDLVTGELQRTDKRPTLAEVAAAAGVSIPTVSKVINRHSQVAPATREHVERVLVEMGYITREYLQKKQITSVYVLADYIDNEYTLAIIQGIDTIFRLTQVRPVLLSISEDLAMMQRCLNEAREGATDGFILLHQFQSLDDILAQHIPCVAVDYYGPHAQTIPSIGFNNWAAGRAATQHLLELGHRRIGIIMGPGVVGHDRFLGYRSALDTVGVPFDADLVQPGLYVIESGYAAALTLLELAQPPTAIFAGNDIQALGVYRALSERGLSVPGDVSVIGCDDIPLAEQVTPALTTIHLPLVEMGKVAARMLLQMLAEEALDAIRIELPAKLAQRSSCASPHH